jgi:thiol-disulfide isomerase/thioredoxin
MIILQIESVDNADNVNKLNMYIKNGKKVFVLFYMDGCGPCSSTLPEWKKIKNVLKYKNDDYVIAHVEESLLDKIKYLPYKVSGFPTMMYISENGKKVENYENSNIQKKDRTIDSFVEWVESKTSGGRKTKTRKTRTRKTKTKKTRTRKTRTRKTRRL